MNSTMDADYGDLLGELRRFLHDSCGLTERSRRAIQATLGMTKLEVAEFEHAAFPAPASQWTAQPVGLTERLLRGMIGEEVYQKPIDTTKGTR